MAQEELPRDQGTDTANDEVGNIDVEEDLDELW